MNPILKYTALVCALAVTSFATGQDKEEDRLNGGSITVVKPYDPTISDAFKIKSEPSYSDTTKIKKKLVTYTIFSVPVASTFTPATGQLSKLKPKQRTKYYNNYARLGLGNYANALAEFAGNFEVDKDSDIGVFLNHNSSQGGIDDAFLDDSFSDTSLDLSYGMRTKQTNWSINGGLRYQTANLYGVYEPFRTLLTSPDAIDAGVNYLSYGIGGKAQFFDAVLTGVDAGITSMTTGFDGKENRFKLGTKLAFDAFESEVGLGVSFDYLQGSFDQQALITQPTDYAYVSGTLSPSIKLYGDFFTATIGAHINYLNDSELSESKLNFYPAIDASYMLVEERLIAFTNIGGGLDMNSLQQFAAENTFLAPTITVKPTSRQLDATLGLKGKLSEQFGYKLYGGYRIENDRYFYTKDAGNQFNIPTTTNIAEFGNVFYTQYADLNTAFFGAAFSAQLSDAFDITLNGQYNSYTVKNGVTIGNVASHLPSFTADVVGDYQITDQWSVGTTLYFVGSRDVWRNGGGLTSVTTLDSFVDLNIDVNYKINPKLTAFLRGNNLTGGNYQYYQDYPVQNLQVMGGVVYKFDF